MIKYILDFEKSALLILGILVCATIASFFNTPMLLHIELDNIFNSFLINDITNNVITTNLEATSTPPLFFWIKHLFISALGFDISMLKAIPAIVMCGIILISYTFISKQTKSTNLAIILAIILATSPFFITASKLISFDLIYILIYVATTFIFTANVYSNTYSNIATFIAGILIAASFSLTGVIGTLPIILSYLLINFIRGGFFINLKFNNPMILFIGFTSFVVIWVISLSKQIGVDTAIDLVFNYKFLDNISSLKFDEGALMKYTTLFIIGGFPWISLLPSAIWNTIRSLPKRLHTSSLETSLPLICLVNIVMLLAYFSLFEKEFYILLAIFFNMALLVADRINNIEIRKSSFINIIFFTYSVAIMVLFLNEFLNIELTSYQLDTTIKNLLIDEHTSFSDIPANIFYIMAGCYVTGALLLYIYTVSRNRVALTLGCMLATLNLILFSFSVFPNLKNTELNNNRNKESWLSNHILANTQTMTFYKTKDPLTASMAQRSFYFDNIIKMRDFLRTDDVNSAYVYFNRADRALVGRLNRSETSQCRNKFCLLKVK